MSFSSSASSIDSTGSFETLQDPREMELQRLRTEVSLLKKEIQDKRSEAQELKESTLKSQISGEWKIVASRNVEEFLEKREGSEVDDIVFQLADIHFQFDDSQKVTVFHKIGKKQYHKKKLSFDGPKWSEGTCSTTYFTEKYMKTVEEGLAEQEVSVEDGNLKIVEKRGGVICERIYRRRTEEDPTNVEDLTRKMMEKQEFQQLVEKLQSDLKEQSLEKDVEIENLKSTVMKTKEENEKLTEDNQSLQQTIIKLQKDLTEQRVEKDDELEKLKSVKTEEEKLQKDLEEQSEESKDIKKSIIGVWRNKKYNDQTVHFKIDEQGNILQKRSYSVGFTVHTPGVRDADGWTFYFENNRLVRKYINPNGATIDQFEWFVEDGELIWMDRFSRRVYKKV